MTHKRICKKIFLMTVLGVACSQGMVAQNDKKASGVFTNTFWDNWHISVALEHLTFYSGREDGMEVSKGLFNNRRSNFGAAFSIGKWFMPELALRTKFSGYWGKAVSYLAPDETTIHHFTIQEQVLFNATNAFMGYDAERRYDVIPYGGVGIVRNATFKETSIGASIGIIGAYAINSQLKAHVDLGMTFAGSESGNYEGRTSMGKYHWVSISAGVTFNLGKTKWNSKVHRSEGLLPIVRTKDYTQMTEQEQQQVSGTTMILADRQPVPQGMVLINRGHLKMGEATQDSLWGLQMPVRDITVDDFLMDRTEVTNRQYKAFIKDICDSIIAQRMEDPYYGGDEEKVIESLYITNPVTGERSLDARQIIYVYEEYDYIAANKRKFRMDPKERILNTDIKIDEQEEIWISKDTAYVDKNGKIIRKTIERPLTGPYDFLNTYIVNVYPDTTVWLNDFPNANNEMYTKYYFSHPDYQDYPVVGVTWEQANAYCAWRTERQLNKAKGDRFLQKFRLPTEAEWEYAARGINQNIFPWETEKEGPDKGQFFANFMPDDGDFTKDGNIITARVATYPANSNGLYDMAGNVAEWTSTAYTAAGVEAMNTINPQLRYNAAIEDPYALKRKSVRGGSWKDSESHIQSAWRTAEYQNQPRSYIGFRCVQSIAAKPTERTIMVIKKKK